MTRTPRIARGAHGFTLLELLVAMTVLVILIAASLGAAAALIRSRNATATRDLLRTLDGVLEEYLADNQTPPGFDIDIYKNRPGPDYRRGDRLLENIDGQAPHTYQGITYVRWPDTSAFFAQVQGATSIQAMIQGIPERFLVATPASRTNSGDGPMNGVEAPSVVDLWSADTWPQPYPMSEQQLIYYVHPKNILAQGLYGECQNGRPYFFSAGPDKLYGETTQLSDSITNLDRSQIAFDALKDNIYSYEVDPLETALATPFFQENVR